MRLMLKCKTYVTLEGYQEAYGNDSWREWNLAPGDVVNGWRYDDGTIDITIANVKDNDYKHFVFTIDKDDMSNFKDIE